MSGSTQDISFGGKLARTLRLRLRSRPSVLSLLSKERGVYGIRNGDHERYQRHCSNKIHRLRQVSGLTCGKGKTYKKPAALTKETIKDVQ